MAAHGEPEELLGLPGFSTATQRRPGQRASPAGSMLRRRNITAGNVSPEPGNVAGHGLRRCTIRAQQRQDQHLGLAPCVTPGLSSGERAAPPPGDASLSPGRRTPVATLRPHAGCTRATLEERAGNIFVNIKGARSGHGTVP